MLLYQNHAPATDLVATSLYLEKNEQFLTLVLDLNANLKVLNKQMRCYQQAVEFQKIFPDLKEVEIEDAKVLREFELAYEKFSELNLQLRILVAEKNFDFAIEPSSLGKTIVFQILDRKS